MDESHWGIIHNLNTAEGVAIDRDLSSALIGKTVEILTKDLQEEERLMTDAHYPFMLMHSAAHKKLVSDLTDIHNQSITGFRYMSLRYTLGIWERSFLDHIDFYDMQWVEFSKRQK
jgi:hemerythrin